MAPTGNIFLESIFMGILSASVSITRYRVEGDLSNPATDALRAGLKAHAFSEVEDPSAQQMIGWTLADKPYQPTFDGDAFIYGPLWVFALRIDKKTIPAKAVKKYVAIETARKLKATGRKHLAATEKKMVKEHVINALSLRVPAVPNIFDVIWNYEAASLWCFSHLKAVNEELQTLFLKSFKISLIRVFPYTAAEFSEALSARERDRLTDLSPTHFKD